MGLLAAALATGAAVPASIAKGPHYILNGYSFQDMKGVNTAELEAKLKDKKGAHITEADIIADQALLAKELQARHIQGQLFTGLAEKDGRVWVIFDLQHPEAQLAKLDKRVRYLETQNFEGASRIPASALAAATGLRKGDHLSPEKLNAARRTILDLYAKSMPGKTVSLKINMRTKADGEVTLTWMIGEPK